MIGWRNFTPRQTEQGLRLTSQARQRLFVFPAEETAASVCGNGGRSPCGRGSCPCGLSAYTVDETAAGSPKGVVWGVVELSGLVLVEGTVARGERLDVLELFVPATMTPWPRDVWGAGPASVADRLASVYGVPAQAHAHPAQAARLAARDRVVKTVKMT